MWEHNITRKQAADFLSISTRSVDRYIRKWKLSYKKSGNRVMLDKDELWNIRNEIEEINDVVHEWNTVVTKLPTTTEAKPTTNYDWLEKIIELLERKDNKLEEKSQMVLFLQKENMHLVEKLKNTIALPDYTEEKERLLFNKEKLENENEDIIKSLRKKEIENMAYLTILLFIVFVVIFITLT